MEAEDDPGNKDLFDGNYSPNTKRKVESAFGLFCVMRKRTRGDISVDSMSSEESDDFFCSDSDTDHLSECSEFDVILQDSSGLVESESLSTCNSPCDHKIGLEISSMPLTKTFEGPGRLWSVCGSVRNVPLLGMGDGLAACSSLYVNVSTSEGRRDAQLSQTLYQEEDVDEMSFSDIDAMIRRLNLIPDDSDSCFNWEDRNMSKHPLLGLEHCSIPRGIISQGAIAVLHCRDLKHFVRKQEVIIGRSSEGMNVDIDLGIYGYGSKISRRQALMKLEKNGSFSLKNLGKRHILVNGEKLNTGQIVSLTSCSSVNIRGEVFVFKINKEAVRQFLKNCTRRHNKDDTNFRWVE